MSEKREAAIRAAAARRADREREAAERTAERERVAAGRAAERERAAAERAAERERAQTERASECAAKARERSAADPSRDVTPWLRKLGVRAEQARRIAALCEETLGPEVPLEERVRFAVRQLAPPHRHVATSRATAA
jgi:hypothetical protein